MSKCKVASSDLLLLFSDPKHTLCMYVRLALLVFGATNLSTRSLAYVDFPTKVVFKSSKLIPTMIVATIFNNHHTRGNPKGINSSGGGTEGRHYDVIDYISAAMICIGAAGFAYGGGGGGSAGSSDTVLEHRWYGIFLLLTSVVCDAFVPNLQQSLMADGCTTAEGVMVNVNAVGTIGLLLYFVVSSVVSSFVENFNENGKDKYIVDVVSSSSSSSSSSSVGTIMAITDPILLAHLVIIGMGLSCAVLAYTRLIRCSGPVIAVTVATLRKVATVLLSYIFFPKTLKGLHGISGLSVLGGIVLSSYHRRRGGTLTMGGENKR